MTMVTLVLANGPGFPQGSPDHRYEIGGTLTPGGHLDPEAWLADPAPWRARRIWPGEAPRGGAPSRSPGLADAATGGPSRAIFPARGGGGSV